MSADAFPGAGDLLLQTYGRARTVDDGGAYTATGTSSGERAHYVQVRITQAMIDASPTGNVLVTVDDAESRAGVGPRDSVRNAADPTRFRLLDADRLAVVDPGRVVLGSEADGTSVTFTVATAGVYHVESVTGAEAAYAPGDAGYSTATGLNDDDNGWSVRLSERGGLVGVYQGALKRTSTGDTNLYFVVEPGTTSLFLRNFDADFDVDAVRYHKPDGTILSGTRSGDGKWNGLTAGGDAGNQGDGGDVIGGLTAADAGIWRAELVQHVSSNGLVFEANSGTGIADAVRLVSYAGVPNRPPSDLTTARSGELAVYGFDAGSLASTDTEAGSSASDFAAGGGSGIQVSSPASGRLRVQTTDNDPNTAAAKLAAGDYVGFTVDADPQERISVEEFRFTTRREGNSPDRVSVFATTDGGATHHLVVDSRTVHSTSAFSAVSSGSLAGIAALQGVQSVSFRVVFHAGSAGISNGIDDLDDVRVSGTTTPGEPFFVDENAAVGTRVTRLTAVDADPGDTATYRLLDDAGGRFSIDASTGEIRVAGGASLDHETQLLHEVVVEAEDAERGIYQESFEIRVLDVNNAPSGIRLRAPGAERYVDDFSSGIDPARWDVTRPRPGSDVAVVDGRLTFTDRGYLATKDTYDPSQREGVEVRGRYTVRGDDFLNIATRTDGTSGGQYDEVDNGVRFLLRADHDYIEVAGRGGVALDGGSKARSFVMEDGDVLEFVVSDDGSGVAFRVSNLTRGTSELLSATSSDAGGGDRIAFYNREGNRSTSVEGARDQDGDFCGRPAAAGGRRRRHRRRHRHDGRPRPRRGSHLRAARRRRGSLRDRPGHGRRLGRQRQPPPLRRRQLPRHSVAGVRWRTHVRRNLHHPARASQPSTLGGLASRGSVRRRRRSHQPRRERCLPGR